MRLTVSISHSLSAFSLTLPLNSGLLANKTPVVSVVDQSKSRHGVVWLMICVCNVSWRLQTGHVGFLT